MSTESFVFENLVETADLYAPNVERRVALIM